MGLIKEIDKTLYTAPFDTGEVVARIGGLSIDKFVPNINFTKWDDDCWLNINHPDIISTEKESLLDGKIDIRVKNQIHRYYIDSDNQLEYEIIWPEKTVIDAVMLNILFPDGLAWHYQDTLENDWKRNNEGQTLSEYLKDHNRPENVIGSYALKWKDNWAKDVKYKTGKFLHLFRPKMIDALGDECWCDWEPSTGKLSIVLDTKWMEQATFPVRLDPTFGKTAIGGSTTSNTGGGEALASGAGAPVGNGTVTSIHAHFQNQTDTRDVKAGLYDDSSGPDNQIGTENETLNIAVDGAPTWHSFPSNALAVTGSATYWPTLDFSGDVDNFAYDGEGGTNRYYDGKAYGDAWNDPFQVSSSSGANYSMYATYTAATTSPPTTLPPTSLAPTTITPTTIVTTLAPTTLPPTTIVTTLAPTTIVTTLPPTTLPPTTLEPTQAPTTLPPTTLKPTTLPPTSLAPTTLEPTPAPTTLAPTTLPPTTLEPTQAPTTLPPTTLTPTTLAPTTLPPTTLEPTQAPTTLPPTTIAPTTLPPTTLAPTTLSPTTVAPTTQVKPTIIPTTLSQTTPAPTTLAPTTFVGQTTIAPTTVPEPTTLPPTTFPEPTTILPTSLAPTTVTLTTPAPPDVRRRGYSRCGLSLRSGWR